MHGRAALSTAAVVLVVIVAVGAVSVVIAANQVFQTSPEATPTSSATDSTSTFTCPNSNNPACVPTPPPVPTSSNSGSTTASGVCTYPAQPMAADFRVLSDNGSTPISGANITVIHGFNASCDGNSGVIQDSTIQTFTTNDTEWYTLNAFNAGNETITVVYGGQTYHIGAVLVFSDYTCVTLRIPSGSGDAGSGRSPCANS